MAKLMNRMMTAVGFVMLIAMLVAAYGLSSGKVTAMINGGNTTAVASSKAPNNG